MRVGLREFSEETVDWFKREAVAGNLSRTALARQLCEHSHWVNQQGQPCLGQARKILKKLAEALEVSLPASRREIPQASEHAAFEPIPALDCSLEALGKVSVEPVLREEVRRWNAMMDSWHPQGVPKLPGQLLRYWVVSEDHGTLAGLSFHACSWHEKARDDHIGWSPRARVRNMPLLVNNARFLILPQVRVHGLASKVLMMVQDRLVADWQQAYGVAPVLAYTHIDLAHSGQSYRACGWQTIGKTSGRHSQTGEPKQVLVTPLQAEWKQRLQEVPRQRFRPAQLLGMMDETDWVNWDYGGSSYPDGRISKRLLAMGKAWVEAQGDETLRIFPRQADYRAASRLLNNTQVSMDDIFESHRQATVMRCAQFPVVLAVQDSTTLNYDTLKQQNQELCSIGGTGKGIYAHANIAFTPEGGRVLGVLDIDGEFRPRAKASAQAVANQVTERAAPKTGKKVSKKTAKKVTRKAAKKMVSKVARKSNKGADNSTAEKAEGKAAKAVVRNQRLKESVRWIEGLEVAGELSAAVAETQAMMAERESPSNQAMAMTPTRVVTVCDREGDIWDLFERQHALSDQVGLLVRSNGARQRQVILEDGRSVPLRAHMESLEAIVGKEVHIAAQGGKRARDKRTARVFLRIARVHLKAPAGKATSQGQTDLPVIAVSIKEDHPPADIKSPLNWLLLCTEGEVDADNALRLCKWYETRWGIEEYFRTLKSGSKIENRQFLTTSALLKSLVFDAITAWRVFDLHRRAKLEPDLPAKQVIDPEEIATCQMLLHERDPTLSAQPPPELTVREHQIAVGKLAGFRPTNRQPVPGTKLTWIGTKILMIAMQTVRALKTKELIADNWQYG